MAEGIQPVQATVELFDAFTAPMMSIINAANLGANAISAMQDVVNANIDPSSMQMMSQSIEDASAAAERFQEVLRGIEIPESSVLEVTRPVRVPFEWQSTNNIEVFNTSGAERWRQEISSAQEMMNQLARSQERITQNAVYTNVLPPDAANDMIALNNRIGMIQQRIARISENRLNAVSPQAIEQTEQLRVQFNRCLQLQNRMNTAIDSLDLEAANRDYLELEQTVSNTERFIRDNVSEQGRFNHLIRDGQSEADKLTSFIKKAAGAFLSIKGVEKIVEMSDSLVTAKSRLDMMNYGLQTTDELYMMIYGAAQRARGSLDGMTDVVARFGNNARDAFSSNEEVVAFSELVQKQMTIAGASTQEASNAMLQLSQALGSGVLRGDELNSIFEQAPNIIQSIADYLDKPIGKIREMASEGKLTADVVKAAIMSEENVNKINEQFENMPKTWEQMWQSMQNQAVYALNPLLDRVNKLLNSENFQAGLQVMIDGFVFLANVALDVLNTIAGAVAWVSDNWSSFAPVVLGIAAALFVYNGAMIAVKVATVAASAVQAVHNAILAANPVMIVVMSLLVLIGVIYSVCQSIAKFTGIANSGFGVICGGVMVVIGFFKNLGLGVANIALGIWEAMQACGTNIWASFSNVFLDLKSLWYGFLKVVVDVVKGVCDILNWIPFVNIDTRGLESASRNYANEQAAAQNSKTAYQDVGAAFDRGASTFDAFSDGWAEDAFNSGAAWGDGVVDGINSMLDGFGTDADPGDYASAYSNLGTIADNTSAIKDGLDISNEDLKYLRDIAEQEAVNRFTTAEIHIEQTNNNTIANDMDLDGIFDSFTDAMLEAAYELSDEGM